MKTLNRGTGNFIHCTDYDDAVKAIENTAIAFAEWISKKGIQPSCSKGYWLIIEEKEFTDITKRITTKELFKQFIKEGEGKQ